MTKFRHIEKGLLTEEECAGFIKFGEEQGFQESLIQTRAGEEMNKDVRDNDRVIWDARELASGLWKVIKPFAPKFIGDWEAIGLNERFRLYRYKDGQQFKVHPDGSYKRSAHEHSKVTVLLYLNEDFEGGETEFVMPHEKIKPETGMMLLFEHGQLHKGNPVPTGTKYVLRTDIMYAWNKRI